MTRYESAVAWLYALEAAKGMDFKLERVELGLERLGNPQRRFHSLHIAGTNGKGSAAAMAHAILMAGGRRVGLYTSPHLVRFTERIRVDAGEIAPEAVADLVDEIRARVVSRGIALTFFEFTTVMAFAYFARHAVDLAVVEVGLGGRLDATNVIDPVVSLITTIGLDHESYLGRSRGEIAREKGGIIKPGRPVLLGRIGAEERECLRRIAGDMESPVHEIETSFGIREEGGALTYESLCRRVPNLSIALRGSHQRDNAATAIAATDLLCRGDRVSDEAVRLGLAGVRWPGRLEVIDAGPRIILDGAHNPDGAEVLAREVAPLLVGRRVRLLFGVMHDKQWAPMARVLADLADEVVATTVLPPRGEPADNLAALLAQLKPTRTVPDPAAAFVSLLSTSDPGDVILVAGSLFLVGAIYPLVDHVSGGLFPSVSGAP